MNKLEISHKNEWLKSRVDEGIIEKNVISLECEEAFEYLLYSIPENERLNTGRLAAKWLKKYDHLYQGGWWCGTTDLNSFEDSLWGCFKPNIPRTSEGKTIKYEVPPGAKTSVFALQVPDKIWKQIADRYNLSTEGFNNFWEWVVNSRVPIWVTEGAKKAGCILSNGYVAIALSGIWNGWDKSELRVIPELQILSKTAREFIFCFDQDKKYTTKASVTRAILKTGAALLKENDRSEISIAVWDYEEGKGIDDLVAREDKGPGRLSEIYEHRLTLEEYKEKFATVRKLGRDRFFEFATNALGEDLEYNELTHRVEFNGEPLELNGQLNFWLIENYRVQASEDTLVNGLLYVAKKKSYHPVRRYLFQCAELPAADIDHLAEKYLGISETDRFCKLYNSFIKKWLIAAVARVFEPGCKVDYALILQGGKQGIGKSTFFRVLGGKWFDDSFGSNMESTKSLMVLHKSWIQEWAEFDRITSKQESDTIKAFLTRQTDCFVKPYGRDALDYPRQCVLAGTVNKGEFLRDETGDRRFLTIPIREDWYIPNDVLKEERSNIWAAAVHAYRDGKKSGENAWNLSREEYESLAVSNEAFRVSDEWEYLIENHLQLLEETTVYEIAFKVFNLEAAKQDRATQMRISRILTKLGWRKIGDRRDEFGKRRQVWKNPQFTQPLHNLTQPLEKVVYSKTPIQQGFTQPTQPTQPFSQKKDKVFFENQDDYDAELLGVVCTIADNLKNRDPLKEFLVDRFGHQILEKLTRGELMDVYLWLDNLSDNKNG